MRNIFKFHKVSILISIYSSTVKNTGKHIVHEQNYCEFVWNLNEDDKPSFPIQSQIARDNVNVSYSELISVTVTQCQYQLLQNPRQYSAISTLNYV